MVLFGAPYYCLELYIAYTGRKPSDLVLALAGGAAVAPSSLDPWIFLLFWVNWSEPTNVNGSSRRYITLALQHRQHCIQSRRINRSNTMGTSSTSEPNQHHIYPLNGLHLSPKSTRCHVSVRKLDTL